MTPNELWKTLSAEDHALAGEAFWTDTTLASQQGAALEMMAKRYNFRLKKLKSLNAAQKGRMLVNMPALPEPMLMVVIAAFHLAHRRELLADFLNAAGIPHKNGMLEEGEGVTAPTAESAKAAVEAVKAKHPADQVKAYLEALYMQDPEFWKELKPLLGEEVATK